MWAGILAYLDHCGYDYVSGCVSVPIQGVGLPGQQARGVRDFVLKRHRSAYTVLPYRPVRLDEIPPPHPSGCAATDARLPAARHESVW